MRRPTRSSTPRGPSSTPPTPSALPPLRWPRAAEAFARGRVYAVFGPPSVGVTTLLRALLAESTTAAPIAWTSDLDVARKTSVGTEVFFLDGYPKSEDDVQRLYDDRWVAPGFGGAVIRVERNAVPRTEVFWRALNAIEARIFLLGMPYFVLHNDVPERAVVDLAGRTGLWR